MINAKRTATIMNAHGSTEGAALHPARVQLVIDIRADNVVTPETIADIAGREGEVGLERQI